MAWTTPATFSAGAVLTAAQLNAITNDLKALLPLDQVAWTTWTPTLTQTGAVTKTVTYAKYTQVGKGDQVLGEVDGDRCRARLTARLRCRCR